ncbi:hypothetical protein ACSZNF_08695 [Aeromonas hydrophila]
MFRPSRAIETEVRNGFEKIIFDNYSTGEHRENVSDIINLGYQYYEGILNKYIVEAASVDTLKFFLNEYEYYSHLSVKQKKGNLNASESRFWEKYGHKTKRAVKYLSEQIINYLPNTPNGNESNLNALSYCFIAAEEMVNLYMCSETARSLYPDECCVTLSEKGSENFMHFRCNIYEELQSKININDFIVKNEQNKIEPLEYTYQNEILGGAFLKTFKMDYSSVLWCIDYLIEINKNYGFFDKKTASETIVKLFKKAGVDVSVDDVITILNGFCLSKHNTQDRVIYNPKQEYRAFKRGFFEVRDGTRDYIFFSYSMAKEALTQLAQSVCFRQLPKEWLDINKEIKKALDRLSNLTGKWFEKHLSSILNEYGIQHLVSVNKILTDDGVDKVPNDVGDIDIIAIVDTELHIIECKMVQFASEPRRHLDDVAKFIRGNSSYHSKFLRKIEWVNSNLGKIKNHLMKSKFSNIDHVEAIKPYMVTFYPSIVSGVIDDFQCINYISYTENHLIAKNK